MTCTGDQEVYAIFKRLSDNLGELVYMIFIGLPGKDASGWYVPNKSVWAAQYVMGITCMSVLSL